MSLFFLFQFQFLRHILILVYSGIVSYRNHPDYPQRPRVDHLSETDKQDALANWKRQCKRFTDRKRKRLLKEAETVRDDNITYSGVTDPRLRTMAEVSGARLRVNDSFPNRDVLAIRIVEEAIQSNTSITVTRSDSVQYRAVGINFFAQANKNLTEGWVVNKIQVNTEGAGLVAPADPDPAADPAAVKKQATTPLRTDWLVVLVLE